MKRIICFVILTSMMLHCASRLGVLSFLYQKRHTIAYHIGLIAEIPIAMCSSDYDVDDNALKIEQHTEDQKLPVQFNFAREIVLFLHDSPVQITPSFISLRTVNEAGMMPSAYASPSMAIFHPPCEA